MIQLFLFSVVSGGLWENWPNDEKYGWGYFHDWHFARQLIWWLLSGEVLLQESKLSANLERRCSSLTNFHTLSLYVVCRRSSVGFMPFKLCRWEFDPTRWCWTANNAQHPRVVLWGFLCLALKVEIKIIVSSHRPISVSPGARKSSVVLLALVKHWQQLLRLSSWLVWSRHALR